MVDTRKLVRFWLDHPAVVGRLMPTLIRTRVVAARNMSLSIIARGAAGRKRRSRCRYSLDALE